MTIQPTRQTLPMGLAIAGLGTIGLEVAKRVDRGEVPGVKLTAVAARDTERATGRVSEFRHPPNVVPIEKLAENAAIVLECAPSSAFSEIAEIVLAKGLCLMPLSVGALLERPDLVELADRHGGRIVVPTGAIIGLDAVRAMAVGRIYKVLLQTRKPPGGLAGAPYLLENDIDISQLAEPLCVLRGTAREAARAFPANVNVAAALALAGIGPDKTLVEVWADPGINRNMQSVTIESDSGEATMVMKNIPSDENPRTGKIVANSVIATLRRMTATLVVGS